MGQPMEYVNPVLPQSEQAEAKFALLEKSIADGQYQLISLTDTRPSITNDRQERIIFNSSLTGYAFDFSHYQLKTYVDRGNYNLETVVALCTDAPPKTTAYTPCNSAFAEVFVPMGVTKSYVGGGMSTASKKRWEDPYENAMRYVNTPRWVLERTGVFQQLAQFVPASELASAAAQNGGSQNAVAEKDVAPAAVEQPLEVNNQWQVTVSNTAQRPANPLYITLKNEGAYWSIVDIAESKPNIAKSEPLELFMASRDLQHWFNAHVDQIGNCNGADVRHYEFHTVCSSTLAEKKLGMGILKALIGASSGQIPFAYTDSKVKAAINSIRPQQAQLALDEFEKAAR